jgi:xylulokinase
MSPEEFYATVGANLDSSHAVFKALWVRDEEPELWKDAATLMSPARTRCVRSAASPPSTTRTRRRSRCSIPRPGVVGARPGRDGDRPLDAAGAGGRTQSVGRDHRGVRRGDGALASTQVAVGCGDEMAATLGAGVFSPGEVCDVVGTAEPVCAASAEPREDPTMLVECHPHADPDAWLLENPGFVSGGNLRWWRDQFAPIERSAEAEGLGDAYDFLSKEAATVPRARRGWCSCRACRARWRPSGTARRAACSTGSRSRTPART